MTIEGNPVQESSIGVGSRIPLGRIQEAGTYVCNWSGHLLRMSQVFQCTNGSPFFNLLAREPLFVTKLSNDPFVPVSKARQIASNLDVRIDF